MEERGGPRQLPLPRYLSRPWNIKTDYLIVNWRLFHHSKQIGPRDSTTIRIHNIAQTNNLKTADKRQNSGLSRWNQYTAGRRLYHADSVLAGCRYTVGLWQIWTRNTTTLRSLCRLCNVTAPGETRDCSVAITWLHLPISAEEHSQNVCTHTRSACLPRCCSASLSHKELQYKISEWPNFKSRQFVVVVVKCQ